MNLLICSILSLIVVLVSLVSGRINGCERSGEETLKCTGDMQIASDQFSKSVFPIPEPVKTLIFEKTLNLGTDWISCSKLRGIEKIEFRKPLDTPNCTEIVLRLETCWENVRLFLLTLLSIQMGMFYSTKICPNHAITYLYVLVQPFHLFFTDQRFLFLFNKIDNLLA